MNFEENQQITAIHQQLQKKIRSDSILEFDIHRSNVLTDSFIYLQNIQPCELLKKISVTFIGEDNINPNSSTTEWINLLVNEIFDPETKLFVPSANENGIQPNTMSNVRERHLEYVRFAGQIIALSIINNIPVNAHFTPFFLKHILHRPVTFKDLEDTDESLYESLQNMLQNDVTPFDHTFTFNVTNIGLNMTIELKPGGTQIKVTNDNKEEFVKLVADYYLRISIKDQLNAFIDGFESLISHDEVKKVTPTNLDLIDHANTNKKQ